jgi:hypothetical protein
MTEPPVPPPNRSPRAIIGRVAKTGIGALLAVLVLAGCGGGGDHVAQPAERHLVYVAGEDPSTASVWVADVDGADAHRLGRGSAAVLSHDGRKVAMLRRGGIYVLTLGGSSVRRLTPERLQPQAWSPDGTTLIATRAGPLNVLELDAIDGKTGKVRVIASGSMYGFGFSPDGSRIAYSQAPVATGQGLCGDQFDIYSAKLDGSDAKRLTHDGLSAFPVWGRAGIAFSRLPEGTGLTDCSAPGIWTMNDDGSGAHAVIERAPVDLATDGLFGLQPIAWLDDRHILAGIRTNAGTLGTVVDTQTRKLRRLPDFVDAVSSDGRFAVGGGGDENIVHLAIVRLSDGHRVFRKVSACCPSWNR